MDPADPRRPIDRERALERLHRLTIASAVVGVVATGAFASIAAASDSGSETAASQPDTTTNVEVQEPATTAAPTDDDATPTPTPTVRRSTGSGHATTGGSS